MDKLNSISYAYHYRNLDSTEVYARRAEALSDHYQDGRAEALNHLAFVSIMRMDYVDAYKRLATVMTTTDNEIELLVADIQFMRLCQRESKNKEFYDYRERALRRLHRIDEERTQLTERQQARVLYAQSEYAIVNSTYFYYVGLEVPSIEALEEINPDEVQRDTAQFLNYLYNIGAGGMITNGTRAEINQTEFDYLMRCYLLARDHYPYWEANAMQAISEHLILPTDREQLIRDNLPAMKFINVDQMPDSLLAGNLAQRSLDLFMSFGDVYQIAGAYRTLAQCYWGLGDYRSSLFCLQDALNHNTAVQQAPDLVASIREQLSVVYAAINDKRNSDINRNIYLDLQEQTRQDRQLEARAEQLDKSSRQLNWMILAVVVMIILVVILLFIFDNWRKRENSRQSYLDELNERYEEAQEQYDLSQRQLVQHKRQHIEQRAKVALVNSVMPLIERMLHEAKSLETDARNQERLEYIRELTDNMNEYNHVLTQWIQMRQGELNVHIESLSLQPLFDILQKGRQSFQMKGITLRVEPTTDVVKADRTLTLFMLNTIADNARKYTPSGGEVTVSSMSTDNYVEISVADTGIGMTPEQAAHIFDHQIIHDESSISNIQHPSSITQKSHGFGLMNCKGIIEKYRKISQIFTVCDIQVESQQGKGSRFFFRLPKGVIRCLVIGIGCWMMGFGSMGTVYAQRPTSNKQHPASINQAAFYADSAYFSNLNGSYAKALQYADSALIWLERCPDKQKWQDKIEMITLDVRNESAVAALALHDWERYRYNNKVYTQLFRERSADNTLGDYVRMMQQSESDKTVAIILLVLLLSLLLPVYYFMYYRHRLYERFSKNAERQTSIELLEDECRRAAYEDARLHISNNVLDNCLSTLKHETMYFPSRIRQMIDSSSIADPSAMTELVTYYKELYGILSAQAMRQVEAVQFRVERVVLKDIPTIESSEPLAQVVKGDPDLLKYLFEILQKKSGEPKLTVEVSEKDSQYTMIKVEMPHLTYTEEECLQLFTPLTVDVQYMICRQIVREIGECTNARGCGILAHRKEDGGVVIEVTLVKGT